MFPFGNFIPKVDFPYLVVILGVFSFLRIICYFKTIKLRNEYLKDIRDELRNTNGKKNN
jgi:hypothetical protein